MISRQMTSEVWVAQPAGKVRKDVPYFYSSASRRISSHAYFRKCISSTDWALFQNCFESLENVWHGQSLCLMQGKSRKMNVKYAGLSLGNPSWGVAAVSVRPSPPASTKLPSPASSMTDDSATSPMCEQWEDMPRVSVHSCTCYVCSNLRKRQDYCDRLCRLRNVSPFLCSKCMHLRRLMHVLLKKVAARLWRAIHGPTLCRREPTAVRKSAFHCKF
jgi:hypothetical protein